MSTRVFRRRPELVTRMIAGETLLVPIRTGVADLDSIYALNETGTFVWNAMDGAATLEAIASGMASEFEVSNDSAAADVAELTESLLEAGLLDDVPCGPQP